MTSATKMSALVSVILVLLLTGCGFGRYGDISDETRELLEMSGAADEIPWTGLPDDTSLVVGKAMINFNESPVENPRIFRLGIIVVGDDGEVVRDFFAGIPRKVIRENKIVEWNEKKTVFNVYSNTEFPKLYEHLPELFEDYFELTFKEFRQPAYYLLNPPVGTAYIWVESATDRQTTTQIPLVMNLEAKPGNITRKDIYVDARTYMYELFIFDP